MESLDQITRALGAPRALWRLRRGSQTVAAVARWRHRGAVIDLSRADAYQVIFNVSGGQVVALPQLMGRPRQIRAGSVGINSPEGAGIVRVRGQADTLQILVSPDLMQGPRGDLRAVDVSNAATKPELQAAAVQALVAVENGSEADQSELERIVLETARCLVPTWPSSAGTSRGGLSPGARRRVGALFHSWLLDPANPSLRVVDMANAAGLSLCHFIRSYQRTEGQTPHAKLLTARIDRALELLLQTDSPISWISDATCFSSPSHFVSTFRSRMGVTPGMFRNAARAVDRVGAHNLKSAIF